MKRLVLVATFAFLLAGCFGGGDDIKAPTPGPTPTRAAVSESDRAYARNMCRAFGKYLNAFGQEVQRDPQLFADQQKLLRVAAPILDTFGKDLDAAKAPKDASNFHNALVERVKVIAKKAKSGEVVSTEELSNISKDAPQPPKTVRERLDEAAAGIPECEESGGMDAVFGAPE